MKNRFTTFTLPQLVHAGSSDSQSEDDEDENSLLTKASRSWGRGGLRVRDGKEFPISQENKEGGSSEGAGSLAKKYEEDEDACFSRLKSLWQEKVGGVGGRMGEYLLYNQWTRGMRWGGLGLN